jgi:hypothetical protein
VECVDAAPRPDEDDGAAVFTEGAESESAVDGDATPDDRALDGRGEATASEGSSEKELPDTADPLRFNKWMKRSATGAVMSGIALGLQEALTIKKERPAFVMEAPGEPEDDEAPIQLKFDPDDPTSTVAIIRRRASERRSGTGPDGS